MGCGMCGKCTQMCGWLLALFTLLFLLQDLMIWEFWNISWYTVVFFMMAMCYLGSSSCKDCCKAKKK